MNYLIAGDIVEVKLIMINISILNGKQLFLTQATLRKMLNIANSRKKKCTFLAEKV